MRTLLLILFVGLMACNPQPAAPAETPPAQAEQVTESGQPLAAQEQTVIVQTQRVYLGWHLTTATGAIQKTGGTWILTKAFLPVPQGQTADPAQLINDLIRQMTSDGTLSGVDLWATSKNWLIITSSSLAGLRETMILDSRKRLARPK
ncbi:MAG: hypothetical protein IPH04_14540 [Saprospirales bacterium]|nr:hypothetical protein [Saprospirales bacterium]